MTEGTEFEKLLTLTEHHVLERLTDFKAAFDAGHFPVVYAALLTSIKHVTCTMEDTNCCAIRSDFTPVPIWALKAALEFLGKLLAGQEVESGMGDIESIILHQQRWDGEENALEFGAKNRAAARRIATREAAEQGDSKSEETFRSSWDEANRRIEETDNEEQIRRALYATMEDIQNFRVRAAVNVETEH